LIGYDKMNFDRHVFVCTNSRESGNKKGSCAEKNSLEIMSNFKRMAKEIGLESVRVNKSGCLGACEMGPACVIYPDAIWYTLPDDKEKMGCILEHLSSGEICQKYVMVSK